jgi:hypothetical protein
MTYEEMMAEARQVANEIASQRSTLQRIHLPTDQLVVLLMTAYAKGISAQSERAVQAFAPQMKGEYRKLTGYLAS